jgi:hypothetical protein
VRGSGLLALRLNGLYLLDLHFQADDVRVLVAIPPAEHFKLLLERAFDVLSSGGAPG